MRRYDLLLAGIGGQGVITLGTLLKLAALREGVEVTGAERRGGAQREGPVTANVRYRVLESPEATDPRRQPFSGQIPRGGAHLIVSLEPLEAARWLGYANAATVFLVEPTPRLPTAVRLGAAAYPPLDSLWAMLREVTPHVYPLPLEDLSKRHFGSLRQVNVLALGAIAALGRLPISDAALLAVVEARLPDYPTNRRAFELGQQAARSA